MKILAVGGAGYIGSHTVKALLDTGHKVFILDNLSNGAVKEKLPAAPLLQADISNLEELKSVTQHLEFDAVMHFASKIEVGQSQIEPQLYYETNVLGSANILALMRHKQINTIIFSSTAAVYGIPQQVPIPEDHQLQPINTYGRTKKVVEEMIIDYVKAYGLSAVLLRYFNAAGASTDGTLGEWHSPETHVVPLLLHSILQKKPFYVYGRDYDTSDGTAIRDYVHVMDIADAHVRALESYHDRKTYEIFNIGTQSGYSVQQLIQTATEVTGQQAQIEFRDRRSGDPAQLIASSKKIHETLGWEPQYSDLKTILSTAYYWEKEVRLPALSKL